MSRMRFGGLGAAMAVALGASTALGQCPEVISTYTEDENFSGGAVILQAGFAQGEVMAVEYVLTAADFPLKINLIEGVFGQQATVDTTTEWSVVVYEGNPVTGTLIAEHSSNGVDLPHLQLPAGSTGAVIAFSVDPGGPNQLIINANSTNSFTVGYRIDAHHNPSANPCIIPPPSNSNAFPATDTSGLASPQNNWLFALNCGPLGCRAGWSRFNQLGLCTPSGDWIMRATWESLQCDPGACCLPDGSCLEVTADGCNTLGGTFHGSGTTCGSVTCPQPTQACCFPATGNCGDLDPNDCLNFGGVPGGVGTQCSTFTCFPEGACCLPDGMCLDDMTPEDCTLAGGTFQGDGTDCGTTFCPPPEGACCTPAGTCGIFDEAFCITIIGGTWAGVGTTCDDLDGNGTADACEAGCTADWNGDTFVNTSDFIAYLNDYNAVLAGNPFIFNDPDLAPPTGVLNTSDFIAFLNAYNAGCP